MTTLFVILRLSKDHVGLCDSVSNYPSDLYVIKFFKNVCCLESGVKFPRLKNTNKIQTKTARTTVNGAKVSFNRKHLLLLFSPVH